MRVRQAKRERARRFAAVGVFLLSACRGGWAPVEPVSRTTFVEVIVALRRAANETPSQPAFETRKASILEEAGVTEADLLEYVRTHAGELEMMASVWDSIEVRLRPPGDSIQ
jgi:hypothetical protein